MTIPSTRWKPPPRGWWIVAVPVIAALSILGLWAQRPAAGPTAGASAGPSARPVPVSTPATACDGVDVAPGDDLDEVLSGRPEGTTFCFNAGRYELTKAIIPRSGQTLVGGPGSVLDGGGIDDDAVRGHGGYQDGVTVRGFEITDVQQDGIETGADWIVEDNHIHDTEIGVRTKIGSQIRRNRLDHNERYGLVANGYGTTLGPPIVIEQNEISFNNTAGHREGDEGGTKLLKVRGLVVRSNWVHHNDGNGLWTDGDNVDVVYERNVIHDNAGSGIFHEISHDAVIRDNVVRNNRVAESRTLLYGSQIHVQNSRNVDVHDNIVEGTTHGIGIVASDRGAGLYGRYRAENITVHDNLIISGGTNGAVGSDYVTSAGNTFSNNRYVVPDGAAHWVWGRVTPVSWDRWQQIGNDAGGTRRVVAP